MANRRRAGRADLDYQESDDDDDISDSGLEKYSNARKTNVKSYTYEDIKRMLEEECPNEFKLVLNQSHVHFSAWAGERDKLPFVPTSKKRLRFGNVNSPVPEFRDDDKPNFELTQAFLLSPIRPFWYLTTHGRVIEATETKRLRALTCFLFLHAGHIHDVQYYPEFEESLKDAIVWYGQGLEVVLEESSNGVSDTHESAVAERSTRATQPEHVARPAQQPTRARRPKGIVEQSDGEVATVSKKRKVSDDPKHTAITKMREHYERLGHYIDAYEADNDEMVRDRDLVTALKRKTSQSAQICADLTSQLKAKDNEIASLTTEKATLSEKFKTCSSRLTMAESHTNFLKSEDVKGRLKLEEEQQKRNEAEKKLADFVDAHTKMMELYIGQKN